jgi:hypothetical protein
MGLRKSIVFIGSVLVLAACDSASSPTGPLSLHEGSASAKKDVANQPTITTRTTGLTDGDCIYIKSGETDSAMVCNAPSAQ